MHRQASVDGSVGENASQAPQEKQEGQGEEEGEEVVPRLSELEAGVRRHMLVQWGHTKIHWYF